MKTAIQGLDSRLAVIFGILTASSLAQLPMPTMSLEATAINGQPVGDQPISRIAAFAGDIITAEVYVRDWSPNGELLSGYQAALLPSSFSSGKSGFIEPVQYETLQKTGEENLENSYVDDDHPRYVHLDMKTLSLADTRSEGYRWMSVTLQGKPPKSEQDGQRYYAATIKFEVSPNAQGVFSLELDSHPDFSGLRNATAAPINPVNFEALTIKVLADPAQVIKGLNRAGNVVDAQVDVNRDGERNARDLLHSVEALNEPD
ncbi:MAG: hypothetical protein IH987_03870 [Planctomycetes bacterium]|nr:hypothetical protein [Planctomycetota bacterium]